MLDKSVEPSETTDSRTQLWSTRHHLILTVMWLLTTVVLVTMFWLGVRERGRYGEVRTILQAGYAAALIWYLIRSGHSLNQVPELQPLLFPRRRYGAWIPVLGIALLLALTANSDAGLALFLIVTIVATIGILGAWRRQIRLRFVVQGLVLTLIIYFPALINAITFGLLHERTMVGFLVTGLICGLAMATVFARRDWEHAVGAHK